MAKVIDPSLDLPAQKNQEIALAKSVSAASAKEQVTRDAKAESVIEVPSLSDPSDYLCFSPGSTKIRRRFNSLDEPKPGTASNLKEKFPAFVTMQYTLPIEISGMHGAVLPLGLTVVSGGTKAGKTLFIKALAARTQVSRVMAVEPFDTDDEVIAGVPCYNSVDAAVSVLLMDRLTGSTSLPVLDSLRESLYEISGAAGSKGVTNAFFTALTRVSNALAKADQSVVAIVNPMHTDSDYVKEFHNKLSSAVPALIWIESNEVTGEGEAKIADLTVIVRGTFSSRPKRVEHAFKFDSSEMMRYDSAVWAEEVTGLSFAQANSTSLAGSDPDSVAVRALYKSIQS